LNQDNEEGLGECIDYNQERILAELTIDGLNAGMDYQCFYSCFSNYPTWPGYISYSSDEPITNISITTLMPQIEDEDNAQMLSILAVFIALVI